MTRWYRAYEGTVTDAKLGEVAMVAGCSRSVAIAAWHCILESAAGVNAGGAFDATPRRVAVILCEPLSVIEAVFAELASLGMIAEGVVSAWAKRQFESDSSTERSRKHRETKRNADATPVQRCATPPDTDTDTETKEEKKPSVSKTREKSEWIDLPDDFQPNASVWEVADKCGFTERQVFAEIEKMRDWSKNASGGKGRKKDWDAALRKWLRTAYEQQKRTPTYSKPSSLRDAFAIADAVIDEQIRREQGHGPDGGEVDPFGVSRLRKSAA